MTKELPDKKGALLEETDIFGEQAFVAEAVARFPDLEPRLTEFGGLHVAMGVLASASFEAIAGGDFERLEAIFDFLGEAVSHPNAISEIENAVTISFVSTAELQQSTNGRRALDLMPSALKRSIQKFERREAEHFRN